MTPKNYLTCIENQWKLLEYYTGTKRRQQTKEVADNKATSPSDTWRASMGLNQRHTTAYAADLPRNLEQLPLSPTRYKLVGIVW